MYHCPICEKENTSLQCSCGFDASRDYEGYPTLVPLEVGHPSRAAAGKKLKDLHRCKGCGGLLFYLNPVKGVCVCAKCGQEVPVGAPKPKAAPVPAAPAKPAAEKVITYDAYMRALEQKFLDNGRKPLSQAQIDGFLRENQLDKRFNIRSGEIRKDLETIYAKYKPQNAPKQVSNYDDYIRELDGLYVKNGKQPLSPAQIRDFILTNNLGNKFGITIPDVQKDLKTIEEKYRQYGNLATVLKQKSGKDTASLSNLLSQLEKKK